MTEHTDRTIRYLCGHQAHAGHLTDGQALLLERFSECPDCAERTERECATILHTARQ